MSVQSGRASFQIPMLAFLVVTGLGGLGRDPTPNIDRAFGSWSVVFYAALGLSAAIALVGVLMTRPTVPRLRTALSVEWAGLVMLASSSAAYTAANIIWSGWAAWVATGFTVGIAAGSIWRCVEIGRDLSRLAKLPAVDRGEA